MRPYHLGQQWTVFPHCSPLESLDDELIALILQLQREYMEQWGRWITVEQVIAALEGVQKES